MMGVEVERARARANVAQRQWVEWSFPPPPVWRGLCFWHLPPSHRCSRCSTYPTKSTRKRLLPSQAETAWKTFCGGSPPKIFYYFFSLLFLKAYAVMTTYLASSSRCFWISTFPSSARTANLSFRVSPDYIKFSRWEGSGRVNYTRSAESKTN